MTTPEQSTPANEPARVLGTFDAACVVVGAIIGVGIFFTPKQVVQATQSGELALIAWALAGGIALCGALTFAALGRRYHASGAQYEVLRDAYGPLPGFVFVFCNATAIQPGAIAIIGLVCAENLAVGVAGRDPTPGGQLALAAALIVGLMGANIVGVRWGSRIQNLTVLCKLLTLLAVTFAAAFVAPAHAASEIAHASRGVPGAAAAVLTALVATFFSYGGWQHALWISGEVRDPRRTLPRAIVGGVVLVVIVYLLANWAYLRLLGAEGVASSGALAADAASVVAPGAGARIIAGAVAVSAFGVLNAQFLSGPRLLYGMARDGRFFSEFGRLSARFGTPAAAVGLLGVFALWLLVAAGNDFDAVDRLLTGVVAVDSVFFGLTGAAIFVLARRLGPDGGTLRALGYPVVPAIFVVGELGVVAGSFMKESTRSAALLGALWIVLAVVLYGARFRSRRAA
ncbi:MAG TPA: amino acid permease [Phycisphaerales bacterium]|nr:amino acid permease [Phycisphaerales bacterium]